MRRLLWMAWWVGFVFVLAVVACLAWVVSLGRVVALDSVYYKPPQNSRDVAKIAVFGDTQKGIACFEKLADRAKAESVDLAIHTGDLVSQADYGHYQLALRWVRKANLGVPFIVAPGNHDIKGGDGLFESLMGSRQFAFRWGPVDVVVVDNAVAPPGEAAVKRLLEAAKGPILLFMHVPPIDTTKKTAVPKSAYNCFIEMIRQYPVRYVFSGHAHDYSRIEDNGIVFISNGVGGDSDSWQFNQKAHLTIVEADAKSIKDRSIVIEPVIGIRANLEHLAIGHVVEIVFRTLWGAPSLVLLILLLIYLFRKLRRKKEKEPEPEKPKFKFTMAKTSEPPDIVI